MIIIDGIALVNAIPKTERIKICNYFAQVFLDQLSNMAGDSEEVRLVFDIYSNTSQITNGQREIYILPCQGHYLNPEYFSEESPLEYQDKSRTNNISSCKDYIDKHAEVFIASPETVIFLMMVQMYPSLPCDISFLTGKGNLKRNIPVQPVYNKLRHISASSILGFHDQT